MLLRDKMKECLFGNNSCAEKSFFHPFINVKGAISLFQHLDFRNIYLTNTLRPPTMLIPLTGRFMRWPARLKMASDASGERTV